MIGPIPIYLNSKKNGNTLGNNAKVDSGKRVDSTTSSSSNKSKLTSGGKTQGVSYHIDGGGLAYPLNNKGNQSRMVFQAIKVIPPYIEDRFDTPQIISELKGYEEAGFTQEDIDFLSENDALNLKKDPVAEKNSGQLRVRELGGEKVQLFIPVSFLSTDSLDYSTSTIGVAAAGAMKAAQKGAGLMDMASEAIGKGFQGIADLTSTGLATEAGRVAAARFIPSAGGAAAATQILTRANVNPNLRSTFNSAGVREFNFQFKLISKNLDESLAIKNIIKFFRFHSYPDEIAFGTGLEYPNMFRVKIQSRGTDDRFKNVGTPMKLCYCKTVSVTYNATSAVLHEDGSPTEVDLTLTFQEYKALNRDDIRNEDEPQFFAYEGVTPEEA